MPKSMYRVVDTIDHRKSWIHRYPEYMNRGEGVLILLDPNQISDISDISGKTVTVHKPDGNKVRFIVGNSEVRHSKVGIFIKNVFSDEIPRESLIEW